jgi:hypothetical protein
MDFRTAERVWWYKTSINISAISKFSWLQHSVPTFCWNFFEGNRFHAISNRPRWSRTETPHYSLWFQSSEYLANFIWSNQIRIGMVVSVLECSDYLRGVKCLVECDHAALQPLFQKQFKGAIYERWFPLGKLICPTFSCINGRNGSCSAGLSDNTCATSRHLERASGSCIWSAGLYCISKLN